MFRMKLMLRVEPNNPYYGVKVENVHTFDPKPYECPFCKDIPGRLWTVCHIAAPGAIVAMTEAPIQGVKGHPELKGKELWMVGVPFICDNEKCENREQVWPLGVAEKVKEVLS